MKDWPDMMTIEDLRKYLRTSFMNAKKLVIEGLIPGNQVNERGDMRVLKSDVDEWIRKGKTHEQKGGN